VTDEYNFMHTHALPFITLSCSASTKRPQFLTYLHKLIINFALNEHIIYGCSVGHLPRPFHMG